MIYGCIGEHLKHSFSKEIHNALTDYDYEICEIPKDKLEQFAKERQFKAINVTIPYKQAIMPYLYYTDDKALQIGAVNTVVNKNGKLYGYNTDFFGMCKLFEHAKINVSNKKAVILGTGGTSKTAYAVLTSLGAKQVLKVSRAENENAVTYDELYKNHTDTQIIVNTTPSGMYPNIYSSPVDISKFPSLEGVCDAVYNPLRTQLISQAEKRGIPCEGGLYMLVAQAVRASEIFTDTKYEPREIDRIYSQLVKQKQNIVLIGMPSCGKTTVGKILSEQLCKKLIDTDALIVEKAGIEISEIFEKYGEEYFRDLEQSVIEEVSSQTGIIVATGGGAVLRKANAEALKMNGRLYYINRPVSTLMPTPDRPLASSPEAILKRYYERHDIYLSMCDKVINDTSSPHAVANEIYGEIQ